MIKILKGLKCFQRFIDERDTEGGVGFKAMKLWGKTVNTGVRAGRCRALKGRQDGGRGWQEARKKKIGEANYREGRDDHNL